MKGDSVMIDKDEGNSAEIINNVWVKSVIQAVPYIGPLIDNLLSPTYSLFRNAMYQYHIEGLDIMSSNIKNAKENIGESIMVLKSIYDTRPNAFLLRVFMDSKADEIVNIFSDGPRFDTFKLKENLIKISPINAAKWNEIK